jgi:hypothetical protein
MKVETNLNPGWEIEGVADASRFFLTIRHLVPIPVFFMFEGTSIAPDVWALLESNAISPLFTIPKGTIWPKARAVHVAVTDVFLGSLGLLVQAHAEPEICDHFHVYDNNGHLLQWYDAFLHDSTMLIDVSIREEAVRRFCQEAGTTYKPHQSSRG